MGGGYAGLAGPTPDWPTPDCPGLRRIESGVVEGKIRRRGMGIGRRGAQSRLGTELRAQCLITRHRENRRQGENPTSQGSLQAQTPGQKNGTQKPWDPGKKGWD